ncbi:hypothetical protein [Bradyrhizobium sp.]|uniref:hypothetical protein n=1 Tax=Bradyrhizobium sp. TaxID=376 RepID=UPI002C340376|nr:hypothetical protein [Bradyrhizobium sp.]HWX64314.1 hypothetical protein [Bradyrhizobium sp.]
MCDCNPLIRTPFCSKLGCKQPVTITIDPEKLVIATENHRGHRGRHCIVCGAVGWIDSLDHKPDCPLHPTYKPKTPMVLAGEWDAIWSWHNDKEHECARKQEYGDA